MGAGIAEGDAKTRIGCPNAAGVHQEHHQCGTLMGMKVEAQIIKFLEASIANDMGGDTGNGILPPSRAWEGGAKP